jgi:cobalt-zinc-cadmium efflux system protein
LSSGLRPRGAFVVLSPPRFARETRSEVEQMAALPQHREHRAHAHDGHSHGHSHGHGAPRRSKGRLLWVLGLTSVYMIAEAVGGWLTNSLALWADAGHMLTDVAALALALFAVWFGSRPATAQKTFGFYRLEILAALTNGVALVLIALVVLYHASERLSAPGEIETGLMLAVAAGGLAVNVACAWLLHGSHAGDLNVRGAWLHLMGDALGSVGAILAGLLIRFYGWYWADAAVSAAIALLIIWSAWHLIRESTNVLLEGTPAHINLASVEQAIRTTGGVEDVHDLHVWAITSGLEALSAHVVHARGVSQHALLNELRAKLHAQFGVDHLTIQMETEEFEDEPFHFCNASAVCFRSEARQ